MADISPHLVVSDPEQALNWYRAVFGAEELSRIPLPDGTAFAIEFGIGDTHLHLAGEYPDMGIVSPATLGGTYLALQVETDDVDATFERAIAAGAKIFHPRRRVLRRAHRPVHRPLRPPLGCAQTDPRCPSR